VFDDQDNLRVFFGTGKYLVGIDKDNSSRNAYYCIIETKFVGGNNDDNDGHYTNAPASPLGPSDLADMTAIQTEGEFSNYLSGLSEAEENAFNDRYDNGWYFQLDDPGTDPSERVLEDSTVVAGVSFFATAGNDTTLSADGGGNITERYKELGPGLPSKVVFHRDAGSGLSSVMVQTSDTTVYVETVTLTGRLWGIGSWKTVD
jgi:Tfp pilus tip-associated adhesin PilY1